MRNRLFLVDVDDTLVMENTTYGFLARVMGHEAPATRRIWHRLLLGRSSPVRLLFAAVYRGLRRDLARGPALKLLEGVPRERLEAHGAVYAARLLERAVIPEVRRRLEAARDTGERVVLVSGGLEEVVSPLARALEVEHRASTLAYVDGLATGGLETDLLGRKLDHLAADMERAEHVTVVTDNLSDRPLVERADTRVVVLRRPRDRAYWADLEPEFLVPGVAS